MVGLVGLRTILEPVDAPAEAVDAPDEEVDEDVSGISETSSSNSSSSNSTVSTPSSSMSSKEESGPDSGVPDGDPSFPLSVARYTVRGSETVTQRCTLYSPRIGDSYSALHAIQSEDRRQSEDRMRICLRKRIWARNQSRQTAFVFLLTCYEICSRCENSKTIRSLQI
jgi:hypothetical protein